MSLKDIHQYAINKSSFDANASIGYGLVSGALADDTTVGCEEGKDCFKSNFDSNLGGMVSDRFASDTELPMVNMSHDKFCSAIQGTCLGLSGMCGFPDASGKYKKEYADDEKKVKCSDLRPSCDFFAGFCDSKLR